MEYIRPTNLQELFQAVAEFPDAKIMAGGQSLLAMMKQGILDPEVIVSLRGVGELNAIDKSDDGTLTIGAMVTHQRIAADPIVQSVAPLLSETARRVASVQIRNLGTWGGNLSHGEPGADPPGSLIAVGAQLELQSADGHRFVPVEDFFLDYLTTDIQPGEVLTRIVVPPQPPGNKTIYAKHTVRDDGDLAIVGIAVRMTLSGERISDIRIGINGASLTPLRATSAEQVLLGQNPSEELFERAAKHAAQQCNPLDDAEASAEYRLAVVNSLLKRCLRGIANQRPSSIA